MIGTRRGDGAIRIRALNKSYGSVHAVRGLDLDIQRGETVALLGPNGAGKTTTVEMLLGLVAPDAGEISVLGWRPREAVVRGKIAAMLQDSGLMPGVTVAELLELGRRLYPSALSVGEALELSGLTELSRRRVDRLSGGQAQRVRFAMVVVGNPEILVLDEPTRALDVQGRAEFWKSMQAYSASGRTVLFATHYLDEVNENASRVIVMMRGGVIADGDPADIRGRAGTSTVRFTLNGLPPAGLTPDGDARREDIDRLTLLAGVTDVAMHGDRVSLSTADPDSTVQALVAGPVGWRGIEVSPPSLDESFLLLTKESS